MCKHGTFCIPHLLVKHFCDTNIGEKNAFTSSKTQITLNN